ncbi:endospore germination permease [Clostridium sp. JS66]|uniref:GerAB/ArcD/ProY family transporter n=1 Tax=Clostridium sp. JS66 TaxID=3064705 RepID=UPI00298E233F|nr:endospore germination permease [Clostridium sp. JS66]WPC39467.1 endospore germination permease [Clostridium sp. JS66]
MDKIKITNHQLFSLTVSASFGGTIIVLSAVIASISKQDSWIAVLFEPVIGIPVLWIYWFLGSKYPNMTLIGVMREILGKWIGSIIAAGYVFLCIMSSYCLPWYVGNFLTTETMPQTPLYIINLIFVLGVVIGVLYGLETIARVSELFIFASSALFIFAMLVVLPNAKLQNLQPVLENGIIPILKSLVFLTCYLTFPLITIMMIYPINVNDILEAKKSIFKGYMWSCFLFFIAMFMSILVLGSKITSVSQYPTYLIAKEINIGIVFTRMEFIIAGVWIATEFMINIIFFYSGITGLSELLGLKNYRELVIPLGLIVSIVSEFVFKDPIHQGNFNAFGWAPYGITYGLVIPILLLIVWKIKNMLYKRI